jgi:hypothetical protein
LAGPLASPFGKVSFGQGLQPPGDAPEQMLAVAAARLFLKHLPMLLAQGREAQPAQFFDFYQHGRFQVLLLCVAVNHSSMNALRGPTGKLIPRASRKESRQNSLAFSGDRRDESGAPQASKRKDGRPP